MAKIDDADAVGAVQISSPCNVPWDSLLGDERVRHCGACRQNVYNIAAMHRRDALQLITASEGRLCLRILRRPDGTVVTSDCYSRLRAARRRGWWALAGALVVVGWAQLTAMVTGLSGLQRVLAPSERLGGIASPGDHRPAEMVIPSMGDVAAPDVAP